MIQIYIDCDSLKTDILTGQIVPLKGGEQVMIATLRDIRLKLKWTQERLAHEAGVSVKTVARWERGTPPKAVVKWLETKKNAASAKAAIKEMF